jgi:hypothetical protein
MGLSLVGAGATWTTLVVALGRVAVSLLLSFAAGLVLIRLLPLAPPGWRLVLATELDAMAKSHLLPYLAKLMTGHSVLLVFSSSGVKPSV